MDENLNLVITKLKEKTKKQCFSYTLSEEKAEITDSKLGGLPYMKENEDYPLDSSGKSMPLLAQINFEDINLENYPKTGLLQIFTENPLVYPAGYKIKYVEDISSKPNKNLTKLDLTTFVIEEEMKLNIIPDVAHMPFSDYRFNGILNEILHEVYGSNDNLEDIIDDITKNIEPQSGLIGGYADFTQNDPRTNKPTKTHLGECIIKIDSYLNINKIFLGDVGIAWLLISEEDLKAKRFENAEFDWDCY